MPVGKIKQCQIDSTKPDDPRVIVESPVEPEEQDDFGLAMIILEREIRTNDRKNIVDVTSEDRDAAIRVWLDNHPSAVTFSLLPYCKEADQVARSHRATKAA